MLPVRAAVRTAFDVVEAWAIGQPGRSMVVAADDGWTLVDLDGPQAEDLARDLQQQVYLLDEDDVWLVQPSGEGELLPPWLKDPDDPEEEAAWEQKWAEVPPELTGPDRRIVPPAGRQVLVMGTPGAEELMAAVTALAVPLTLVDLGGWTVFAVEDDDVVPLAAGLTAPRRRVALVLAGDGEVFAATVLRRGRLHQERVWGRRTSLVGQGLSAGSSWSGLGPDALVAQGLEGLGAVREPAASHQDLEALLRDDSDDSDDSVGVQPLRRLVSALELGAVGDVAVDVLLGRQSLDAHPRARTVDPPASFWRFLRAGAAGAFLDPDRVPWFSILCALLLPILLVNLVFRAYQLVIGDLDGWGAAQLVGAAINGPIAFLFLRRVLSWRNLRRSTL